MNNNETPAPEKATAMIEAADAAAPNHYRDLAEQMLSSGTINEHSTFADAELALQKQYSSK